MEDENKEPEKPEEEKPSEDKKEEPSTQGSLLAVADRIEKANAETAKNNAQARAILEEQKELAAKKLLGGVTDAGLQSTKKAATNKEYTQSVMRGDMN